MLSSSIFYRITNSCEVVKNDNLQYENEHFLQDEHVHFIYSSNATLKEKVYSIWVYSSNVTLLIEWMGTVGYIIYFVIYLFHSCQDPLALQVHLYQQNQWVGMRPRSKLNNQLCAPATQISKEAGHWNRGCSIDSFNLHYLSKCNNSNSNISVPMAQNEAWIAWT